ncbi:DUF1574 domain-containing protein [Chitinophaga silvatica]|uniref:DUF1574 domain-containing protein n=1 Tax=Chitinophaga silvatica TaxID=2282649 RepID=A0A3E1Y414_9BACT|nr:DUF1574 family protein [Chitinophaga silvatica]RFS19450.1 DUF1574 domain-containing protein [Chitinophaga silvatica]
MRLFIKSVLFFALPIILIGLTLEILLRQIPNDYTFKRDGLYKHADSMQVLFLGSSHAFYGINPTYTHLKSFNAGYISQSLKYDAEILNRYIDNLKELKYVAVPISYFTLFTNLESGSEAWRSKNYTIYYKFHTSNKITDYSEILGSKFDINLKRFLSYYISAHSAITCSELGWGTSYQSKNSRDLEETGLEAAKRHTVKNLSDKDNVAIYNENIAMLDKIITLAKKKDVKVVFYTPPAYISYIQKLNDEQLTKTISTIEKLTEKHNNTIYLNFLKDSSFIKSDFYDADHLNEIGAEKFTKMLDSIIVNDPKTY